MNNLEYFLFPVLAAIISFFTNKYLIKYLRQKQVLDIPNERSSHIIPTPRGGGIGIAAAIAIASIPFCLIFAEYKLLLILCFSLLISLIGWLDDRMGGMKTSLRFLLQIIISAILIFLLGPLTILPFPEPLQVQLSWLAIPISIIWIVGITNIYNFLDGIDGIAGSQGLFAGIGLAILFWGTPIGVIYLIIALACLGFLYFNWHPAKIFMGDVGSAFLGFLLAALPFYFENSLRPDAFFATTVFLWFFLADGTFTIFRRLFRKEKIWEAHRSHLYQRLVIAGLSHSKVVKLILSLYILIIAVFFYFHINEKNTKNWYVIVLLILLFGLYLYITIFKEKQKKKNKV